MTSPPTQPLTFGGVIETAARLYPRLIGPSLLWVLAVAVPVQIATFAILAGTFPEELLTGNATTLRLEDENLGALFGGYLGIIVLAVFAQLVMLAVLSQVAVETYTGRKPKRPNVGSLISLVFALAGVTLIGIVLCGVGILLTALLALTVWGIAFPMLILEGGTAGEVMRRCWAIVKPRFWWTLGIVVVANLVVAGVALLVSTVTSAIARGSSLETFAATSSVGGLLASVATAPLLAAVIVVLFFDLKAKSA